MSCHIANLIGLIFSAILITPIVHETTLNKKDYEMMIYDMENGQPALSAPLHEKKYWESFNEWQCFETHLATLSCDEIEYNHWKESPLLTIKNENLFIEFAVSPDFNWNCEQTLEEWSLLLKDKTNFCIYGSFLQNMEHLNGQTSEYWYINQIKAGNNYWDEYKNTLCLNRIQN